ncbi:MAG: VacJ family lipoprotein [Steroidobacteraceae bacterium]|jgi:phospholipid-binding lipoprotein MlaA|nr:VacJ family lipoprotein [Steroidobacteraceae bacterium]
MNSRLRGTVAALCLACLSSACATVPSTRTPDPRDPFERVNRGTFAFNQSLDKAVLRPAIRGYRKVTPRVVRTGLSNFFSNAEYPVVILNNLLQGKFGPAASDTGRFLLNTTLGVGGFLDPATDAGLDRNNEDFGQTLGRWGVPAGPYVMIPFLGPYTLRDGFGALADNFVEPRQLLTSQRANNLVWVGGQLDRRSRLSDTDAIIDRAGDPYAFVRSAYLQRRQYLVTDGAAADDESPLEDPLDDPLDDPAGEPQPTEGVSGDTPEAPQ